MDSDAGAIRLNHTGRAVVGRKDPTRLDGVERGLLDQWRTHSTTSPARPSWFSALRRQLTEPDRLRGMLLGAAVGEATAQPWRPTTERTSALLFAVEGMLRAHTGSRVSGSGDPAQCVLGALQRWLCTRGIPWQDCTNAVEGEPDGWLVHTIETDPATDDPTMVTALARIAAGSPANPVTNADSATAVPLGALAGLWHSHAESAFPLGSSLAALTHGHPDAHAPAGVLGGCMASLLRGHALLEAIQQGLALWEDRPDSLDRAVRLGSTRPPGFLPGRTQIEAMGAGRSGLDVLGIALRAATACPEDFATAVEIAAAHGGDAATSAMLCGQLLGALHGTEILPAHWLDNLPLRPVIESLAADATAEFGPNPEVSEHWLRRYPPPEAPVAEQPAPPRLASADRFVGAVLGCAIGEALGIPIAADSWEGIQARHGPQGLVDYVPAGHPAGRLGSETQFLLFSLEGVIRANVARRYYGTHDPSRHIQHAYQRWLHTQHLSWPRAAGEFLAHTSSPDGWLVGQRALFQTRNPGRTMMRTLIAFAKGQQERGTPEHPVSDSQGSGAVTRAVPAALWSPGETFRIGMNTAALTHGHPGAYLSAGTLAFLVCRLLQGENLPAAAENVLRELAEHAGHAEVSRRVSAAIQLAESSETSPDTLETSLGSGWTAPDALGIGLHAALLASEFDTALPIAVNHSGNSATSGAVCGSLLGAMVGAEGIPQRWLADLELCEVIETLARDASVEFGPQPPEDSDWLERYPPT